MKTISKSILISALAVMAFSFSSCHNNKLDDFVLWDIYPVSLDFIIVDSDGDSLLDPASENNVLNDNIYVVYNGVEYPIVDYTEAEPLPLSRYYPPTFYGLKAEPLGSEEYGPMAKRFLTFGEFPSVCNQDISIEFVWPEENRRYTARIVHTYKMENNDPEITNTLYLDGKQIDASYFTIVK